MKTRRKLIRNLEAELLLEIFLVAAVAAILVIRFYLQLTNFPQLGRGNVHIAHMLWGGMMMTAAILLLLCFLNRGVTRAAALVGGVGFGTFIDEIGKFISRDNDYFFQPSVAIIYVIFIALALAGRAVLRRTHSQEEYLLNALRELEELALQDLDPRERGRVLELLERSAPANPLVPAMVEVLRTAPLVPEARLGAYARIRRYLREGYVRLVHRRHFQDALVLFFYGQLAVRIVYVILVIFFPWTLPSAEGGAPRHVSQRIEDLTLAEWGQLITTAISGLFVAAGVAGLHRSRLFAYRMFRTSTLITILMTQVFMFYEEQFSAVLGLGLNILLLFALEAAIQFERTSAQRQAVKP